MVFLAFHIVHIVHIVYCPYHSPKKTSNSQHLNVQFLSQHPWLSIPVNSHITNWKDPPFYSWVNQLFLLPFSIANCHSFHLWLSSSKIPPLSCPNAGLELQPEGAAGQNHHIAIGKKTIGKNMVNNG